MLSTCVSPRSPVKVAHRPGAQKRGPSWDRAKGVVSTRTVVTPEDGSDNLGRALSGHGGFRTEPQCPFPSKMMVAEWREKFYLLLQRPSPGVTLSRGSPRWAALLVGAPQVPFCPASRIFLLLLFHYGLESSRLSPKGGESPGVILWKTILQPLLTLYVEKMKEIEGDSCSVMSDSLRSYGQ